MTADEAIQHLKAGGTVKAVSDLRYCGGDACTVTVTKLSNKWNLPAYTIRRAGHGVKRPLLPDFVLWSYLDGMDSLTPLNP
jgi:hypothetical protein